MNVPPSEFDVSLYRENSPDIAEMDDAQLFSHFKTHGKHEGRLACSAGTRRGFLDIIPMDGDTLEIRPACSPLLRGKGVRYFDLFTREQLQEHARLAGLPYDHCPEIDHVSTTGDLSSVREAFDVVFSSHVINRMPDLVRHLKDASDCLKYGGRYYAIIPDKRYCFDHCVAESTIASVLAAHVEGRVSHSAESFFNHRTASTHNDPVRHWNGDHTDPTVGHPGAGLFDAVQEWQDRGDQHLDMHAWHLTPSGFSSIVDSLNGIGLITLRVERLYHTVRNSLEFYVVLRSDD